MRKLEDWLSEYSKSHQNSINNKIHLLCVPLILWASVAILYTLPVPKLLEYYAFNWSYLAAVIALSFYLRLGVIPYLLMLVQLIIILLSCILLSLHGKPLLWIALSVFIVAWLGQFLGHKLEGAKPSFFTDLQFLLIGPLWVSYKLFRK